LKVEISDYRSFLKEKFPGHDELIDDVVDAVNCNLQCKECRRILPFDKFHTSKAFENRQGKYPYCKDCIPEMRKQGKR